MKRLHGRLVFACLALLLAGCVSAPVEDSAHGELPANSVAGALRHSRWSLASLPEADTGKASTWEHQSLPGKAPTKYVYELKDGRDTMAASSASSASLLRKRVHVPASELDRIRFSWKVPDLIADADLGQRDVADSPVRIALAFEGDRSRFSAKNSLLSELAHAVTGEPMPYATLIYVWCNTRTPGTVISSPRTDRIRKLVVESGGQNLNRWLDYERNIRADFENAFGEAPGALVGVAIMTDTDNTRAQAKAWYGKVTLAASVKLGL